MTTESPHILHLFTPARQASPFDVNMAADAGYQMVVPYTDVGLDLVGALTQDAIYSRGPKGAARTGIFIGGRDVLLAADMLDRAQAAMQPPFQVSLMADPSGGYTTAAALVACVEAGLLKAEGHGLDGRNVVVLGGTGPVGRVAGVLAAQAGAHAVLCSRSSRAGAEQAAAATGQRFGVTLGAACTGDSAQLNAVLAGADVVLACAAAGVQVLSATALQHAGRVRVLADVNAVAPLGIEGVGALDNGQPVAGTGALGYGALAIGNVKYQTQHRLLVLMRQSTRPVKLGLVEAFAMARAYLAEKAAKTATAATDPPTSKP
jgi:methylene-tetrahydromethanopterin dehydrogenase